MRVCLLAGAHARGSKHVIFVEQQMILALAVVHLAARHQLEISYADIRGQEVHGLPAIGGSLYPRAQGNIFNFVCQQSVLRGYLV